MVVAAYVAALVLMYAIGFVRGRRSMREDIATIAETGSPELQRFTARVTGR